MRKTCAIFMILGHLSLANAQSNNNLPTTAASADNASMNSFAKEAELNKLANGRAARNVQTFDNRYEGVKGSPFMFEDWSEGYLMLSDSALVKNQIKLKFDLTKNEVWIKLENGLQRILYNKELLTFNILRPDGKNYKFSKARLPEVANANYFVQTLFDGKKLKLVKDNKKVFKTADLEDKGIVTVGKPYDRFEESAEYYFKIEGKPFQKIKLKKQDLLEFAPADKVQNAETWCKTNGIKNKLSEEDAMKLAQYLDAL